jgi:hypothetical protein
MRSLLLMIGMVAFILPAPGRAQQNSVVLELYTSQGCSACPPADALLPKLADIPGVIALALHVDYWDYLGWKDSFGKLQFTKRQKSYARALHNRRLFTPQVVIQGQEIVVGHKEGKIMQTLGAFMAEPSPIDLQVSRSMGGLVIEASGRGAMVEGPLDIQLVKFLKSAEIDIQGGENQGQTVTYTHVVTDWETVAHWDGVEPLRLDVAADPDEPVAVIVQKAGTGPVVTAAELN